MGNGEKGECKVVDYDGEWQEGVARVRSVFKCIWSCVRCQVERTTSSRFQRVLIVGRGVGESRGVLVFCLILVLITMKDLKWVSVDGCYTAVHVSVIVGCFCCMSRDVEVDRIITTTTHKQWQNAWVTATALWSENGWHVLHVLAR